MEEKIVSFQTAKLAEEKGFIKFTNPRYASRDIEGHSVKIGDLTTLAGADIPAPTQSLLQKWLREVHGIIVEITWQMCSTNYEYAIIDMNNPPKYEDEIERIVGFKTFEETLEEGLYEALKLIK